MLVAVGVGVKVGVAVGVNVRRGVDVAGRVAISVAPSCVGAVGAPVRDKVGKRVGVEIMPVGTSVT